MKTIQLILLIYLTFCVVSLFAFNKYGINARSLASNKERYGDIAIGGGYSLAYSAAILSVVFLELKGKVKEAGKLRWIISYPTIVVLSCLIYQTKSTVTLLAWLTGVVLYFILQPKANRQRNLRFLLSSITLVLILFAIFNMNAVGLWLMKYTANSDNRMIERLYSVAAWMANRIEYNDSLYFVDRLSLPIMSLSTFIRNPVFGVAIYHGNGFTSSRVYGISQHGEWADALGNYGLLGGIPLLMIYFHYMSNTVKKSKKSLSIVWCIVTVLIGAFNPIRSFNVHLVIFFIIPALLYFTKNNSINGEKNRGILTI